MYLDPCTVNSRKVLLLRPHCSGFAPRCYDDVIGTEREAIPDGRVECSLWISRVFSGHLMPCAIGPLPPLFVRNFTMRWIDQGGKTVGISSPPLPERIGTHTY